MKKYFIIQNGQQVGPLSVDELKAANINGDTNVWYEGLGDWQKASSISELSSLTGGLIDIPPVLGGNTDVVPPLSNVPNPVATPNYGSNNFNNPNPTQDQLHFGGVPPKTWLVESILVTVLCCLPFGIAGIVNASKVESAFYAGDLMGAQRASEQAAKWTKIGFFASLIGIVLYFLFVGGAIFFASQNGRGF